MTIARPGRLIAAGIALLVVIAVLGWLVPSGYYLYVPNRAEPLAPKVKVEGERDDTGPGGIYYVDIVVRRLDELPQVRRVRQVAPDRERADSLGLALEELAAPCEYRHVGPFGGERVRGGEAHAGRRAADDRRAPAE